MMDRFIDFLVSKMPKSWKDQIVDKANDLSFVLRFMEYLFAILLATLFVFCLTFTKGVLDQKDYFGMFLLPLVWLMPVAIVNLYKDTKAKIEKI